jgi:hypothetical protein
VRVNVCNTYSYMPYMNARYVEFVTIYMPHVLTWNYTPKM